MRNQIVVFVLAFSVLTGLMVGSVMAGGGLTGGATEMTQLANNSELATQVKQLTDQINNQIKMIEDMINNTMALPNQLVGNIKGVINNVMNAYNRAQGILGRLSNLDEEFYNLFYSALQGGGGGGGGVTSGDSESEWITNYSEEYYELSKGMEEQAKKTLESLKVSAEDINDSAQLLQDLSQNASTATGRNAILQAGNELMGFLGGELVKVRTLMTEQIKTYLDYAERQRTIEDAEHQILQQDLQKWKSPTYEGETFEW